MATTITAGNSTNGAAISSDNTGILELKTGTGSGTTGLTINASQNTTLAGTLSAGAITSSGLVTGATGALYPIVSGTSQTAPFSVNTYAEFLNIPPWAKRITVMFSNVSTSGSSALQVQIGDSGGIEATNYSSSAFGAPNGNAVTAANSTTGYVATSFNNAAYVIVGSLVITNISGNIWVSSGSLGATTGVGWSCGGSKELSATLDRVRVTTVNGTDTFDTGSIINIMWE
jgi:hypothetical protein